MGTNVESENLPDAVRVGVGMFLWAPHRVLTLKMPERHLVAPNTSSPALGLQRPRQSHPPSLSQVEEAWGSLTAQLPAGPGRVAATRPRRLALLSESSLFLCLPPTERN